MADSVPSTGTGMNKKILGMPMWVVVFGGSAIAAGVYFLWKKRQASNAANSTTTNTANPSGYQGLDTAEYETLLSQLRDLQGQPSNPVNPVPGPVTYGFPGQPGGPIVAGGSPPRSPYQPVAYGGPMPPPSLGALNAVPVAPYPVWNSTLWGTPQNQPIPNTPIVRAMITPNARSLMSV